MPTHFSAHDAQPSALVLVTTLLCAACALSACGDAIAPGRGGGSDDAGTRSRALVPAAALDRPPAAESRLEQKLAGQVFWRQVRERAGHLERIAAYAIGALDHPVSQAELLAELESCSTTYDGAKQPYVQERLSVRTVALGRPTRRRAEVQVFRPGLNARYIRNYVVHADSPDLDVDELLLRSASAWRAGRIDAQTFGLFSGETPSFTDLERARSAGARAWVTAGRGTGSEQQFALAEDVAGRDGRALPIPLIFICGANTRHVEETVDSPSTSWAIRVTGVRDDGEAQALVVAFKGTDPSRKIIVTGSRDRRLAAGATGAASLALATVCEVARVFATVFSRESDPLPQVTVEFVHVMDGSEGYQFLEKLAGADETILGVVNVQDLAAADPESRKLFLIYDGSGVESALERSLYAAAMTYVGHASGWSAVGIHDGGRAIPASVAAACGQERIPLVSLTAGTSAADPVLRPSPLYPPFAPVATGFVPLHPEVESSGDSLNRIASKQATTATAAGRLLAAGLFRTQAAFAPSH